MALEDPFIGTGWAFPPAFDNTTASANLSTGIPDIEQSLRIIFTTALGERIMRPDFGCSLESQVFEVMNTSRITWLETLIRNAIIYHEPRIDADQISVEPDQLNGVLLIAIGYKVRGSNSRFNFVYPYYVKEAADGS
jgi:phage baseplate assembly protein W